MSAKIYRYRDQSGAVVEETIVAHSLAHASLRTRVRWRWESIVRAVPPLRAVVEAYHDLRWWVRVERRRREVRRRLQL